MIRNPTVYILAGHRNGTLYIGVASDPIERIREHKHDVVEGFTRKCQVHTPVHFDQHDRMQDAIVREKQIKKWNRA